VRTRVFIGSAARAALSPGELRAAVAHERAHRDAFDNVKRFAIYCAPDFLAGSAPARRLEEQWRECAEWSADARAAGGDPARAHHLASALVKVSRLTMRAAVPACPAWSSLHEPVLLERRVRRLLTARVPLPVRARRAAAAAAVSAGLLLVVGLGSAAAPWLHRLTETLAHRMP
jgi:hypothetical protein